MAAYPFPCLSVSFYFLHIFPQKRHVHFEIIFASVLFCLFNFSFLIHLRLPIGHVDLHQLEHRHRLLLQVLLVDKCQRFAEKKNKGEAVYHN